jgi:outer membrane protein assembly factor BamB
VLRLSRPMIFIAVALFAVSLCEARAAEWPQFLGPQRNGISAETNLLEAWPAEGLKILWRAAGGVGMSGLAISQDRLLTLVQRDNQQWLIALDSNLGKPAWQTALAPGYKNQMGDGPRATPTISGSQAFVMTGEGMVASVGITDGQIKWSRDILAELKAKPAEYGMACSPLVVGDRVIITVGAPQATVVALDTATGKTMWKSGEDSAGYSSPALLNIHGSPQIVAFTGGSALGLSPASGSVLWRYAYETDFDCNIATPLVYDNNVFISAGENHGSVMLGLKPSGKEFQVEPKWESQGVKSVLRNEWQTSILLDGYFYGFDNVGSAGPVTHLTCIKAGTGERVWQQPRFGKGNLIAADGKLWISTMNGELVLVRATPDGFQEIGRQAVLGPTRQAPSLSGGRLYLRDNKEIVCIDVRR